MAAYDHYVAVLIPLKKGKPGGAAVIMIVAETIAQPWFGTLQRVVHDVAGDDGILPL